MHQVVIHYKIYVTQNWTGQGAIMSSCSQLCKHQCRRYQMAPQYTPDMEEFCFRNLLTLGNPNLLQCECSPYKLEFYKPGSNCGTRGEAKTKKASCTERAKALGRRWVNRRWCASLLSSPTSLSMNSVYQALVDRYSREAETSRV